VADTGQFQTDPQGRKISVARDALAPASEATSRDRLFKVCLIRGNDLITATAKLLLPVVFEA
jgi:hypothetical protein